MIANLPIRAACPVYRARVGDTINASYAFIINSIRILIVLATLCGTVGCVYIPTPEVTHLQNEKCDFRPFVDGQKPNRPLAIGYTTRGDVESLLGRPRFQSANNRTSAYVVYTEHGLWVEPFVLKIDFGGEAVHLLYLRFDKNDKLERCEVSDSNCSFTIGATLIGCTNKSAAYAAALHSLLDVANRRNCSETDQMYLLNDGFPMWMNAAEIIAPAVLKPLIGYNVFKEPQVKWISSFAFLSLLLALQSSAHSQPDPTSQPADHLRVFLATFGAGSDPWEKFGHNAIVIHNKDNGETTAYNWGVFDFGEGWTGFTSFSWHFIQGRLLYSMQSEPADEMFDEYQRNGRSILLQELNLTPTQKIELSDRLIANDTEANRYYLYDYFKKNCATMARDAIDQTINGRIRATLENLPTSTTYRWHDRRCTADTVWLYLFLDYALGHPVDRPLSAWQECFLPGKLAEHLALVQVPDAQGKLTPLVLASTQLTTGTFPERAVPPTSFIYLFLAGGVLTGFAMAFLAWLGQSNRPARWAFNLLAAIWSLIIGALGTIITFALFSNHAAAKWNENLFQGNPLSLLLILLIPAAHRWPIAARRVVLTVLCLSLFGLLIKLTPWAYQGNAPIIVIALPIHAAIAWGMVNLIRNRNAPALRV